MLLGPLFARSLQGREGKGGVELEFLFPVPRTVRASCGLVILLAVRRMQAVPFPTPWAPGAGDLGFGIHCCRVDPNCAQWGREVSTA